jgi:THO complex subunit 5
MSPIQTISDMEIDFNATTSVSDFNPSDYIKTAHNSRLYKENQNLKRMVRELVDYQVAHPKLAKPTTREEIDNEKKVALDIEIKKKYIRAQMAVMKTLFRQSVMKVREEKEQTAKSRSHNDGLILGLNNLKYEEQSLRSEISAAENHEYALHTSALPLTSC